MKRCHTRNFVLLMKFKLPFSIYLIIFLTGCQQQRIEPLQKKIDAIISKWVPDKRVGVCNLNLVKRGGKWLVLEGESMFPEAKAAVINLLKDEGVSVADSVLALPDTLRLKNSWGLITLSVANLRSKPAHSSELISQAIMGTPVKLLKETDEWIFIQTPDRYIAWTNKSAVHQMSSAAMLSWQKGKRMIFTDVYGSIFQDNKLDLMLSDLVAGAIVVKKMDHPGYAQVELPDGRIGFVPKQKWLNFEQWRDTVSLNGDRMIFTGKQFLGFPYLWGGTSSKALDCSGFVKTVCFLNGVILERDASQQNNHGLVVDISSGWETLRKGDLLFFGSPQSHRVTHVGMYIGNSEFIHESGLVRINSLDKNRTGYNGELSAKLLGAKRIIGLAPELGFWPVRQHNWY